MKDLFETLAEDESMNSLVRAFNKAGLAEMLQGAEPHTLFAPNNEAFIRMDIEKELGDLKKLKSILTYHLVPGKFTAAEIKGMDMLETVEGRSLTIALDEGAVVVDNGKFINTDIECTNGIIHIIDNVFKPNLSGWYRDE